MAAMMATGLWEGTTRMEDGAAYKWLFDAVFIPLNHVCAAGFYIASAAFRAFRARNAEHLQ